MTALVTGHQDIRRQKKYRRREGKVAKLLSLIFMSRSYRRETSFGDNNAILSHAGLINTKKREIKPIEIIGTIIEKKNITRLFSSIEEEQCTGNVHLTLRLSNYSEMIYRSLSHPSFTRKRVMI